MIKDHDPGQLLEEHLRGNRRKQESANKTPRKQRGNEVRYVLSVPDVGQYSYRKLKEGAVKAGLPIDEVYVGSGMLVFEFRRSLTEDEKTALATVIAGHRPLRFVWTSDGGRHSQIVGTAEDVDRITAMRIRSLFGGEDPVQEQLKMLTELLSGLFDDIQSATDINDLRAKAALRIASYEKLLAARAKIVREGREFKAVNNLEA